MKKLILIIFFLFCVRQASGQNTTVSGTITDTPDGQAWFGGTLSFVFRVSPSNPTAQYFFNGAPFSSAQTIAGAMDGSGHYSASVPPNTSITPAGSTWDVTFCPLATAQCVTYQSVTITGATQTFAPSPPSIRINLAVPLQNPRAYTDTEIVNGALGQSYFNLIISTLKLCNFFPCGWATLSGGGGNPANPVGSVQVNVAGSFGPGPQVTTVDIKPKTTDNICYVSGSNGNDTNDGLSIGSAKLTVYSCLTTVLPGGDSSHAGNGTVLISGTATYGGPVANQGFFLMGGPDPNFGSPPAGWLKVNASFATALNFDCYARFSPVTNGHVPSCILQAGNVATNLPSIWISSVGGNITFNNIQFTGGIGNYVRYGIDSNNARTLSSGSEGFAMNNVSMANGLCTNAGQTGPTIDIGGTSFWIWLRGNTFGGCPGKIFTVANSGAVRSSGTVTVTTTATNDVINGEMLTVANVTDDSFNGSFIVTRVDGTHFTYTNPGPNATSGTGQVVTARSAAINMDPGASNALVGLVFIDDTNINGGSVRFRPGVNGGTFYVRNLSYEGNFSSPDPPIVLITGTTSGGTDIKVENLEIADSANLTPGVQVDNPQGSFIDPVVVSRIAGSVRGKMSVMGGLEPPPNNSTYLRKQQYGVIQGQLIANSGVDEARRGFSPVLARTVNLASQNPSGWTVETGTGTITSNIPAPDLTNNAGRITFSTGVPGFFVQFYSSTTALNIGDIYVGGAWVRSVTNNGYAGGPNPLVFSFGGGGAGNGDTCVPPPGTQPISGGSGIVLGNPFGSVQSDGQWQWYSVVCKVGANPTTPGTFFATQVDSTHTIDVYAPTLSLFPAGTISDNESYELAINMSTWPNSAAAGEISMLPNQRLHHGTTTFANLGTPNNASDIYCTDCVVNSNPCVGTGTGAFAQGINGAWVCGGGGGGGGCAPGGITDALQYNGGGTCSFGGVNSPTVNGNYNVHYRVTASAAVPPAIDPPGVVINAQTGASYVEGSANTDFDRGYLITANNAGAQSYTMGNPSAIGFGQNYFNALNVIGAGAVTENASGFTVNGGTSFLTPASWLRWLWSDGVNYRAEAVPTLRAFPASCTTAITIVSGVFSCGAAGAVSSLTGDGGGTGGIFSNVASTGAVTLTLNTTTANKVWANCTGATATPTYCSITDAMLTAASHAALFNASNVWTGLQDFSGATWKIPAAAGFTAGATSNFGLDTTAKLFHCYLNNADAICSALSSISPATTSNTIANANNPQTWNWAQTTNSQNGFTFGDTSAATAGTFNANGTANQGLLAVTTASNSTETPLNITNGSQTGATGPPAGQFVTTCNNSSLNCRILVLAATNTASQGGGSTSHLFEVFAGAAGATSESWIAANGDALFAGGLNVGNTTNSIRSTVATNSLVVQGGTDGGSSGAAGPITTRGANNTNTTNGAAGGAWNGLGGDQTAATGNTVGGTWTGRGGNVSSTGTVTPGPASLTGGSVLGAATNIQGGVVTIAGGLGTGNSPISNLKLQTPGFSTASGTAAQAQVTRYVTHAKAGSTTSATATNMFQIPVATNQTIGVEVIVHVETTQATPQNCSTTETFFAAVQNTGGTVTQQTTAGTTATICSTGTLTLGTPAFSTATPSVFSVTPTWTTIVPTAVIITIEVHNLSQQDITLL